jgi:shikimate dehydrogenase
MKPRRFGLLGEKLAHSFSPRIHALLGDYEYPLYEIAPDKLESFLHSQAFDGLNVTLPYKQAVMAWCASLSEAAQKIGCVNTIVRRGDGLLHGHNTDYFGFAYLLQQAGFDVSHGKILVLGSGGASLTVQQVLRDQGASPVVVASRQGECNYQSLGKHHDAKYIINTTPVGMYPSNGASPLCDLSVFGGCQGVADLIYNPLNTELMLQARQTGIPAVNGLSMLVAQAKEAAECFTGTVIPHDAIEPITRKLGYASQNMVLIGMPGCGKTSVAARLAQMTGRELIDTDAYIADATGQSVDRLITDEGEDVFRQWETRTLEALCKGHGKIIATGGGVVVREINKNILRQNGVLFYLERDLDELPIAGRPLSQKEGIQALAAQRLPLYNAWCDHKVKVCGVLPTADKILELFEV